MGKTPPRKLIALPKVLYAKLEAMQQHDPSDVVLTAAETLDGLNDGEVVGIYELKDIRTVHVSRKLE